MFLYFLVIIRLEHCMRVRNILFKIKIIGCIIVSKKCVCMQTNVWNVFISSRPAILILYPERYSNKCTVLFVNIYRTKTEQSIVYLYIFKCYIITVIDGYWRAIQQKSLWIISMSRTSMTINFEKRDYWIKIDIRIIWENLKETAININFVS